MLDAIIEALYFAVDSLYMRLFEILLSHWEQSSAGMNHGQYVIYDNNLRFAVDEWLADAQDDWPYADADFYVDNCYSSYDIEVLERAFSDTIETPVGQMWEIIYRAQELYETAQMLEAIFFF